MSKSDFNYQIAMSFALTCYFLACDFSIVKFIIFSQNVFSSCASEQIEKTACFIHLNITD